MYLKPEPEYERTLREQSTSISPPGPIDEYLYIQNVNLTMGGDFFSGETIEEMFGTAGNQANGGGGGIGVGVGTQRPAQAQAKGNNNSKAWMKCARVRTPKAYEEVKVALEKIEKDLPPEYKFNWGAWNQQERDAARPMRSDMFSMVRSLLVHSYPSLVPFSRPLPEMSVSHTSKGP